MSWRLRPPDRLATLRGVALENHSHSSSLVDPFFVSASSVDGPRERCSGSKTRGPGKGARFAARAPSSSHCSPRISLALRNCHYEKWSMAAEVFDPDRRCRNRRELDLRDPAEEIQNSF